MSGVRYIGDLSDDDRRVIRERHFGWERATPSLLAAVFRVSVQAINATLKQRPPMPTGQEFGDDTSPPEGH